MNEGADRVCTCVSMEPVVSPPCLLWSVDVAALVAHPKTFEWVVTVCLPERVRIVYPLCVRAGSKAGAVDVAPLVTSF